MRVHMFKSELIGRGRPGLLRRLQSGGVGPLVQMGSDIGLTCSLELGFAFWTRWKLFGLFANLIGPRGESVSKGYVLLEAASVLHDKTSDLLRVLRRRVHSHFQF